MSPWWKSTKRKRKAAMARRKAEKKWRAFLFAHTREMLMATRAMYLESTHGPIPYGSIYYPYRSNQ